MLRFVVLAMLACVAGLHAEPEESDPRGRQCEHRSPHAISLSPEFSRRTGSWESRQLSASKTIGQMVVDHSNRLHVGVHDSRTDETEAAKFQVLADRVR